MLLSLVHNLYYLLLKTIKLHESYIKMLLCSCLTLLLLHCYFSFIFATFAKRPTPPQRPHLPRLCQRALGRPHAVAHLFHHWLWDHGDGRRAPERDVGPDRRRSICGRHQLRCWHRGGLGHLQWWPGPLLRPLPLVHPGGKVGDRQWCSHILSTQAGTDIWGGCWLGVVECNCS